jgi:hypothetical protein
VTDGTNQRAIGRAAKHFAAAKYLRTKLTYEYRVKSALSVDQIRKWAMIHGNAS